MRNDVPEEFREEVYIDSAYETSLREVTDFRFEVNQARARLRKANYPVNELLVDV
jgi:hypothetical protein